MKFELWQDTDTYSLIGVPSESRWPILNDPTARLLLRIESPTIEEAKAVYERFAFEENPDGLPALNDLGESFLLRSYPCGLRSGDRVILNRPYPLRLDGHILRTYQEGLKGVILPGDTDLPCMVWVRLILPGQADAILNLRDQDALGHFQREGRLCS